jgi:hypothetical protein
MVNGGVRLASAFATQAGNPQVSSTKSQTNPNSRKSEFQGEGEIEALERLGYTVEPPMAKVKDRPEFASVIARKRKGFVSQSLDPALKTP